MNSLAQFLKSTKLFSSLSDKTIEKIILQLTVVELKASTILFNQNDPSDSVYIVMSGKLSTILTTVDDETQIIGTIEPGETIGELGVLSKEPRALTIKTKEDSTLLQMSSKDFILLCYRHPATLFATIQPLMTRSHDLIQKLTLKNEIKYITFMPANEHCQLEGFVNKLTDYAKRYSSLIIFSDFDPDLKKLSRIELKNKIKQVKNTKKLSQKIIFLLESCHSPLAKLCLAGTDRLFIIGHADQTPVIVPPILEIIENARKHLKGHPELILLHAAQTERPAHTHTWLQQTTFQMHYHLKINKNAHYHRLLRFIRGKAIGLVLGGGGTRGWAHIGVIKALREQKIPIDFIGGTSVGAIVAACYALQESVETTQSAFTAIVQNSMGSTSWRSLTWPIISIFNGKKFTLAQQIAFNSIQIEDLWMPFFCISSNLATYTEEIHRTGLLWERTRASTSIPGIIPPMVIDRELHLDGGLFNNLPVDVMRKYLGKKGKIIAVELNSTLHDYHKYDFPPALTLKQLILNKLGMTHEKFKFPRFIDTFLRGFLIGSSSRARLNALAATILVNLNLSKFKLLNTNLKQGNKMFEIGYLETMLKLEQFKNNHLKS